MEKLGQQDNLKIIAMSNSMPNKTGFQLAKHGLEMTGLERQKNVLIVPTAKRKIETYETSVNSAKEAFSQRLGQKFMTLHDFEAMPSQSELQEKIDAADMVYVPGGDSDHMMETWQQHGIDKMLGKKALEGMVWLGASAGAIAPMTWGHSDSFSYRVPEGEDWEYVKVNGLGLAPYAITPHYNTEPNGVSRAAMFHNMFAQEYDSAITGLGIDDAAAVIINGKNLEAVAMKLQAGVWNITMNDERKMFIEKISAKYLGQES
jgi:peptidase E